MPKEKNTEKDISVVDFVIRQKTSKKGNNYACLVAIDENDNEYFVAFINSK